MKADNTIVAVLLLIVMVGGLIAFNSVSGITDEMKTIFSLVFFVFMLIIFGIMITKK